MSARCSVCGSYALNLEKEGIDQGSLCDVHFYKAQRDELLSALQQMVEIAELTIGWFPTPEGADGPLIKARAVIKQAEGEQA